MDDLSRKTDEEIAKLALTDREVFAVIVDRYADKLRRYIFRLGVKSKEDADDVLQDIFIKTYRFLNAFDDSFSFSSWIYRITHNETISFFRRQKSRPEGHIVADSEEILFLISDETDMLVELDKQIDGRHLGEALKKLPEKYREPLILKYYEDKSYAEISDILEMPIGTVGTMVNRGKKLLAKELEQII